MILQLSAFRVDHVLMILLLISISMTLIPVSARALDGGWRGRVRASRPRLAPR